VHILLLEEEEIMMMFGCKKNTSFHSMRQTEADIFQPSVGILLNKKKGCIVIADELIGCRSSDVER